MPRLAFREAETSCKKKALLQPLFLIAGVCLLLPAAATGGDTIYVETDGAVHFAMMQKRYEETGDVEALLAIARYRYAVGAYAQAAKDFKTASGDLGGEAQADARVWEGISRYAAGDIGRGLAILERRIAVVR